MPVFKIRRKRKPDTAAPPFSPKKESEMSDESMEDPASPKISEDPEVQKLVNDVQHKLRPPNYDLNL